MWERNRKRWLLEGVDEHEWKESVFKSQMEINDENIVKLAKMNEEKENDNN